ncbi:MAG: TraB/GumN family protein [Micavibrio aeruginosavorus]|nr:TraB/GumN family protein [Micavibrio aeruginosavorus]
MKKSAFPRLLALSLCCTLISGASHAAKPDPAAYPPQPAMFLVKDGDSTAYIFGSAHKVKRGVAWRTDLFDTALARADEVWLEATREEMSNPILGIKVMRAGYNMRDSLSKILSDEEYAALEEAAYGAGVDMSELNHLRPWAASMALQGYAYQSSVDSGKQKKLTLHSGVEEIASSITVGKPLKSIENVEKHMMLFANLSPQEEKELLMYTVNEINKPVNEEFKARMKLWAAGDLDALNEATNVPMKEKTPGLYNLMMTQRNQEMAGVISKEMDNRARL